MRTRLVRIGNSRGLRLPKPLLAAAGLSDEVEIIVKRDGLFIRAAGRVRAGWAESIEKYGPSKMIGDYVPTRFDEEEWEWK